MSSASVIYDKVNSLAPAFERTQPATLLLGLKIWLLDMTGGTCTNTAAPCRALHARAEKIKEKRQEMSVRSLKVCFVDKNAVHGKTGLNPAIFLAIKFFA